MPRRFAPPRPIAVESRPGDDEPVALAWRGRLRRVARVEETWALDAGWWEGAGGAARRAYYRLIAADGLRCVVYRDRAADRWYLEQIID